MPRPLGASNKDKKALVNLLQRKYPGWEPVMEMAEAAMKIKQIAQEREANAERTLYDEEGEEVTINDNVTTAWLDYINAVDRVAKYTTPQIKAIEITLDADVKHQYFITGQPVQDKKGKVIELDPDSWAKQHTPKHT